MSLCGFIRSPLTVISFCPLMLTWGTTTTGPSLPFRYQKRGEESNLRLQLLLLFQVHPGGSFAMQGWRLMGSVSQSKRNAFPTTITFSLFFRNPWGLPFFNLRNTPIAGSTSLTSPSSISFVYFDGQSKPPKSPRQRETEGLVLVSGNCLKKTQEHGGEKRFKKHLQRGKVVFIPPVPPHTHTPLTQHMQVHTQRRTSTPPSEK